MSPHAAKHSVKETVANASGRVGDVAADAASTVDAMNLHESIQRREREQRERFPARP